MGICVTYSDPDKFCVMNCWLNDEGIIHTCVKAILYSVEENSHCADHSRKIWLHESTDQFEPRRFTKLPITHSSALKIILNMSAQ